MIVCVVGMEKEMSLKMEKDGSTMPVSVHTCGGRVGERKGFRCLL